MKNLAVALVALVLLSAAACGDDDDENSAAGGTATTGPTQPDDGAGTTTTTQSTTDGTPVVTTPDGAEAEWKEITVTPADGLRAGDTVTVTGSGWEPGGSIGVAQCAPGSVPGPALRQDCAQDTAQLAAVAADGSFSVALTIEVGPMGPGGKSCNPGDTCVITVQTLGLAQVARANITIA